jgi:class 3 adenylate cyclase/streptogramin lyase
MPRLPRGTVTFLFSDIEGSTELLRRLGHERYGQALADYQRLVRESCRAVGGTEVDTQGDAFFFVFPRAKDAVEGAAEAQRSLARHGWPDGTTLRARIGLHTGEASVSGSRYVGLSVHRAARVGAAAAGGQVLVSQATASLVEDEDLGELGLRDLGSHVLKDFERPVRLYQLQAPDLADKFPAAKTKRAARERPTVPLLVAAVTVFVVALGVSLALIARDDSGGASQLDPGSVGVIDPQTNRLVDEIKLGFASPLIAAGEGHVWVVDPQRSTLVKIDPGRREVVGTFAIEAGAIPTGIAVGNGSVWVGTIRGRTLELLELGPELGNRRGTTVLERSRTPLSVVRESVLPALEEGAVFTLEPARGQVSRIEAAKVLALTEGLDASSISAGTGSVWLGGRTNVLKLAAATGRPLVAIPVGGLLDSTAFSVEVGTGAVWFAGSAQPRLFRIDPSGAPVTTFPVGQGPSGIGVGEGAVWVASADGTVSRVNPDGTVEAIQLGAPPAGIVAAYGSVWTSPAS